MAAGNLDLDCTTTTESSLGVLRFSFSSEGSWLVQARTSTIHQALRTKMTSYAQDRSVLLSSLEPFKVMLLEASPMMQ